MKEDKTLVCKECGKEFVFSASEQEFYESKGFTNEPGRCPACRQARKQRLGIVSDRPARQMYPAVCAECGKAARCIRQFALNAVKKPKFRSNRPKTVRFTAATALTRIIALN